MHRFEWNNITNQVELVKFVSGAKAKTDAKSYCEQAARLFYKGSLVGSPDSCLMIELQVPTSALCADTDVSEKPNTPWLDAHIVRGMNDYDISNTIFTMWRNEVITFENAESVMLEFAKDLCD